MLKAGEVREVLATVPIVLTKLAAQVRALAKENDELCEKIAEYQFDQRARNLAGMMEQKGWEADKSFAEKVATIKSNSGKIDALEMAVAQAPRASSFANFSDSSPGNSASKREVFEHLVITGE